MMAGRTGENEMKVAALIKALSAFDPELDCVTMDQSGDWGELDGAEVHTVSYWTLTPKGDVEYHTRPAVLL